jgi:phosphoribosyl-ATP pyrophosphohydrolase
MSDILNDLYVILQQRKNADPESSYVASLYKKGTRKISDKVIEEANEAIEEALKGDTARLKEESADLLFHLMVLWADQGVAPDEVFSVLEKRFGTGGHAEKASRKK